MTEIKFPIAVYKFSASNQIEVRLHDKTLWLSLNQIAMLYGRDKSVISKHLKNIFSTKELNKQATVANFATVQSEGIRQIKREIEYYNLDAILSVGYKVKSKQGIKFRQWSNDILKTHLINEAPSTLLLKEEKDDILSHSMGLLKNKSLLTTKEEITNVISDYAKTWTTLFNFDRNQLSLSRDLSKVKQHFSIIKIKNAIEMLKQELIFKKEATTLFGQDTENSLDRIFSSIYQTFGTKELYKTLEEKAAHLFYFIIKDHPFTDGNKRIASFVLLLFLHSNDSNLELDNSTLIALALLTAESSRDQKDIMISLVINLIK